MVIPVVERTVEQRVRAGGRVRGVTVDRNPLVPAKISRLRASGNDVRRDLAQRAEDGVLHLRVSLAFQLESQFRGFDSHAVSGPFH